MKRYIFLVLMALPMFMSAQTSKDSIAESSGVYEQYMLNSDQIVTYRSYEVPEIKWTAGSGITKITYKSKPSIQSFTIGETTNFFLCVPRTVYLHKDITRYLSYEQLVELRSAIDDLEANMTKNPVGEADELLATYTIKNTNYEVGYKITVQEKRGERINNILWFLNIENREEAYRLCTDDVTEIKDYLADIISRIRRLK